MGHHLDHFAVKLNKMCFKGRLSALQFSVGVVHFISQNLKLLAQKYLDYLKQ